MVVPSSLADPSERANLLSAVYELADALDAMARYLLVFDGPLDAIDIDELLVDIGLDAADAVVLMGAVGPRFVALIGPHK